jgi:hypothetical protein
MNGDRRFKWTEGDIAYLREAYPQNVPLEKLIERFNKSGKAIEEKARRLGLGRSIEVLPEGLKRCPDCKIIKTLSDGFWPKQSVCKDCQKARRVQWGMTNREHLNQYGRKRRRNSPELLAAEARRHHKVMGLIKDGHDLTASEWDDILKKYNNICPGCGKPFTKENPATRDCVVPLAQGGTLTKSNVQPLHNKCNNHKGKRAIRYEPLSAQGAI